MLKLTWVNIFSLTVLGMVLYTLAPAYAQIWSQVCPYWAQEDQPISTHMNLRGLSDLPDGLPLDTLIYRHAHGTWLRMELGYYGDFVFGSLSGPTPSRNRPEPYFEEAEASQTKEGLVAYLEDALRARAAGETREVPSQAFLIPGTIPSPEVASDLTKHLDLERVLTGNNYAFWHPNGRYVEREGSRRRSLFPCEAGRETPPSDASEEFVIVFNIRQGFIPFHPTSAYQKVIEQLRTWTGPIGPPSGFLANTYPYAADLDTTVTYRIHHADDDYVARFTCRPLRNQHVALPPACEGIALWPDDGLAVSLRFPSQKGVVNSEALYLEPVQAVYNMIQNWKTSGEPDG